MTVIAEGSKQMAVYVHTRDLTFLLYLNFQTIAKNYHKKGCEALERLVCCQSATSLLSKRRMVMNKKKNNSDWLPSQFGLAIYG